MLISNIKNEMYDSPINHLLGQRSLRLRILVNMGTLLAVLFVEMQRAYPTVMILHIKLHIACLR